VHDLDSRSITYHILPGAEWAAANPGTAYVPAGFERDGFVHCTDGLDELAATANRYFSTFDGELLVLVLDRARLTAPVRYEDPRQVYPHVYGSIDRDAIAEVLVMPRDAAGVFLAPSR
jgi:uncharacterized protein (DUF952 family)